MADPLPPFGTTRTVERRVYANAGVPFADTRGVGPEERRIREEVMPPLNLEQRLHLFDWSTAVVIRTPEQKTKAYLAGWVLADFSRYKAFAIEVKGDLTKLREASARGEFEGTLTPDGSLSYMGVTAHWRDLEKVPVA
jgi:hypothetical protein